MIFITLVTCHSGEDEHTLQFSYAVNAETPIQARNKAREEIDNKVYRERGLFIGAVESLSAYNHRLSNAQNQL